MRAILLCCVVEVDMRKRGVEFQIRKIEFAGRSVWARSGRYKSPGHVLDLYE